MPKFKKVITEKPLLSPRKASQVTKINAIKSFIFSDESYFELTPSVNRQNNKLWLKARPTEGIEHPLYDKKVLVFCAMSCQRIYGPYFFESTVNENNYHKMLVQFFWPKVVREDLRKYYF